jgi:Mg2+-importing ATPase
VQERGALAAVDALLSLVRIESEVLRDGAVTPLPLDEIVPGDVVILNAGDVIPADALVLDGRGPLVDESALTGESFPIEKVSGALPSDTSVAGRTNSLFLGTHVVSGEGSALVVVTGRGTELGRISSRLRRKPVMTGFEHGVRAFGLLLVRATFVLTAVILVANVLLSRPFVDSLLFSLALAVGLTPQLLPAIVTVSLARGARRMARERVIVKRLETIEDFGSMQVLCTDKTGTLTSGSVELVGAFDVDGRPSDRVLELARINAAGQTGFTNPLDAAILEAAGAGDGDGAPLDEIPYDFRRKRLSVLASVGATSLLITKGAFEQVTDVCSRLERAGGSDATTFATMRDRVERRFEQLSGEGYRVLGLAVRDVGERTRVDVGDERDLTFVGFLAFLDPPKDDARETHRALAELGVSLRMLTGDNRLAAARVAELVGLDADSLVTGAELASMDESELARRVGDIQVFAEVEPEHKERILAAFRTAGFVTGFLGDGINDAPALRAADVGISVNTAVDVAKQAAAIVLLEKDLGVVLDGVRLGRQTFANTMKYIFVTTSANFGNMLSMAGAAAFLPFLPLLPRQILLLNFLSDLPGTTIATDAVDPEQVEHPEAWDVHLIRSFMIVFGLISSAFDVATFVTLRVVFDAHAALFHTAWFVESTATELAVMLVLRTRRPALRSRPSAPLLVGTVLVAVLTAVLPWTPVARHLGLVPPHVSILLALVVITAAYVICTELAKAAFWSRHRS